MTKIGMTGAGRGVLPLAVLALLAAGCGTQRPGDDAGARPSAPTVRATASALADFPCPGESPTPTSAATASGPAGAPTDHYAENHGFRVPIPLHGRLRCDGLAAVARVEKALEPLRERGDFDPDSTRDVLTGLGYPAGKVRSYQNGDTGVGFLVDAATMCLEGTMNRTATKADAFGGYPDGSDCEPPSGGH
ncbi:hypothetical protein ACF061_26955 [Streptomyces sp. NPDC015220]|uniref:hypothetical protein n=1 Tax=Streptomyces sp. NPDC015220 TaxID=3364947 RepID=UPI00370011E4